MRDLDIPGGPARTVYYSKDFSLATPFKLGCQGGRDPQKAQIFLHIPKCGGTTLSQLLACGAQYQGHNYRRYIVRDFSPGALIRPGWTGAWQEVQRRTLEGTPQADYITGHFPFGVHEFLSRKCRYTTLLRDPVRREISVFNYMHQKGFIRSGVKLDQLITDRVVLDNPQVRMLAGIGAMSGLCTEETYLAAVDNLEKYFDMVGVVEESADFIRALAAWNGWLPMLYARAQVTGVRIVSAIDQDLEETIENHHSFDVRLHRYAAGKWQDWKRRWVIDVPVSRPDDPILVLLPAGGRNRQWGIVKLKDTGRLTEKVVRGNPLLFKKSDG